LLKKVFIVFLIVVSALAWCSCSGRNKSGPASEKKSGVGDVAPDLTLKDLQGRDVSLASYKGHVVLLDFWATWCPPCMATVPELVNLGKKYKDRGLVVLAVSLDEGSNIPAKLSAFSRDHAVNYTILLSNENVERMYNVSSIPTMYVIGKDGTIRNLHVGYMDNLQDIVSAEIDKLI
jgi:thiol-disulfide isomerase/thioredoxin